MIMAGRLKALLKHIPDDALVNAYEGELTGISIIKGEKYWWIDAKEKGMDTYTEGFETDTKKKVKVRNGDCD